MSSNKFLQRFEGKMKVMGKEGVHELFGSKKEDVVYTNTNFNQKPKMTANNTNSQNKSKSRQESSVDGRVSKKAESSVLSSRKEIPKAPLPVQKQKEENPFLISNPFYLEEEEREQMERERKQREIAEKAEKEKERQKMMEGRKGATGYSTRSVEKKKGEKEWVKMGGLGANIGGDEWLQKKKKQEKMAEFASQVKSINKDKPKIPKAQSSKQDKRQPNARQKALEYSKNVPKPVVRQAVDEPSQQIEENIEATEEKLSELQLYELRHQQYKNMLKNQL